MGVYLNPGNSGFAEILQTDYVDKTGLIGLINRTIGTKKKLTCISRPRRFGKSYTAQMLCAYYDKTCDSREFFAPFIISQDQTYENHLGKYDVIYVDMTYIKQYCDNYDTLVEYLPKKITEELLAAYPEIKASNEFPATLMRAADFIGNRFIVIIDEWDAPIRENQTVAERFWNSCVHCLKAVPLPQRYLQLFI